VAVGWVWILNWIIVHLQLVTASKDCAITVLHTSQITIGHIKSSLSVVFTSILSFRPYWLKTVSQLTDYSSRCSLKTQQSMVSAQLSTFQQLLLFIDRFTQQLTRDHRKRLRTSILLLLNGDPQKTPSLSRRLPGRCLTTTAVYGRARSNGSLLNDVVV
jgi:hypothetical protein